MSAILSWTYPSFLEYILQIFLLHVFKHARNHVHTQITKIGHTPASYLDFYCRCTWRESTQMSWSCSSIVTSKICHMHDIINMLSTATSKICYMHDIINVWWSIAKSKICHMHDIISMLEYSRKKYDFLLARIHDHAVVQPQVGFVISKKSWSCWTTAKSKVCHIQEIMIMVKYHSWASASRNLTPASAFGIPNFSPVPD